jgi:hypothetical protein
LIFPLFCSVEVGSYVNTNDVFKEPNDVFKEPGSNKRCVCYFALWLKKSIHIVLMYDGIIHTIVTLLQLAV